MRMLELDWQRVGQYRLSKTVARAEKASGGDMDNMEAYNPLAGDEMQEILVVVVVVVVILL